MSDTDAVPFQVCSGNYGFFVSVHQGLIRIFSKPITFSKVKNCLNIFISSGFLEYTFQFLKVQPSKERKAQRSKNSANHFELWLNCCQRLDPTSAQHNEDVPLVLKEKKNNRKQTFVLCSSCLLRLSVTKQVVLEVIQLSSRLTNFRRFKSFTECLY